MRTHVIITGGGGESVEKEFSKKKYSFVSVYTRCVYVSNMPSTASAPDEYYYFLLFICYSHTRHTRSTRFLSVPRRGGGRVWRRCPTGFHGSAATRRGRPTGNPIRRHRRRSRRILSVCQTVESVGPSPSPVPSAGTGCAGSGKIRKKPEKPDVSEKRRGGGGGHRRSREERRRKRTGGKRGEKKRERNICGARLFGLAYFVANTAGRSSVPPTEARVKKSVRARPVGFWPSAWRWVEGRSFRAGPPQPAIVVGRGRGAARGEKRSRLRPRSGVDLCECNAARARMRVRTYTHTHWQLARTHAHAPHRSSSSSSNATQTAWH